MTQTWVCQYGMEVLIIALLSIATVIAVPNSHIDMSQQGNKDYELKPML